MERLASEGLVERGAGRGTFVTEPQSLRYPVLELTSFSDQMRAKGKVPSSEVLRSDATSVTAAGWEEKQIGHTRVLSVDRLRLSDGVPTVLEYLVFPLPRFAALDYRDLVSGSMYDVLERSFGVTVGRADFTLNVALANGEQGRWLEISENDPIFIMRGLVNDTKGRVIVGLRCFYRGDRYTFDFSTIGRA